MMRSPRGFRFMRFASSGFANVLALSYRECRPDGMIANTRGPSRGILALVRTRSAGISSRSAPYMPSTVTVPGTSQLRPRQCSSPATSRMPMNAASAAQMPPSPRSQTEAASTTGRNPPNAASSRDVAHEGEVAGAEQHAVEREEHARERQHCDEPRPQHADLMMHGGVGGEERRDHAVQHDEEHRRRRCRRTRRSPGGAAPSAQAASISPPRRAGSRSASARRSRWRRARARSGSRAGSRSGARRAARRPCGRRRAAAAVKAAKNESVRSARSRAARSCPRMRARLGCERCTAPDQQVDERRAGGDLRRDVRDGRSLDPHAGALHEHEREQDAREVRDAEHDERRARVLEAPHPALARGRDEHEGRAERRDAEPEQPLRLRGGRAARRAGAVRDRPRARSRRPRAGRARARTRSPARRRRAPRVVAPRRRASRPSRSPRTRAP